MEMLRNIGSSSSILAMGGILARRYVLASALFFVLVLMLFSLLSTMVNGAVFIVLGGRVYALTLACGSEISIGFNNSVTGSHVRLVFSYCGGRILGRAMYTDEAGADYYSSGVLDVNESVSSYASGYVAFCSSQDLYVSVGGIYVALDNRGGCLAFISLASILSVYIEKIGLVLGLKAVLSIL